MNSIFDNKFPQFLLNSYKNIAKNRFPGMRISKINIQFFAKKKLKNLNSIFGKNLQDLEFYF